MRLIYTSLQLDHSHELGSLTYTIDNVNIRCRFFENNCAKELRMQWLLHTIVDKN